MMNVESRLVSVVVTTKNEQRHIGNCLQSISDQDYANIEMIVVDNNSSDSTKQIASTFTSLIFNKGPERASQRNYGMLEIARGHYVAYFDADMLLVPDLVSRCVAQMESVGDTCVGLHIDEMILGSSKFSSLRRFERSFYTGTVIDGSRFFRRSEIQKVGGFDESLPPGTEDWDLDIRLSEVGSLVVLDNRAPLRTSWAIEFARSNGVADAGFFVGVFHNESHLDLKTYFSKKSYYQASIDAYARKWKNQNLAVKKQLGVSYRLIGVFFESGRWRRVLKSPHMFVLVFMIRLVVGIRHVLSRQVS